MLDAAVCYRALQSRDPRFDGHFFTGVTSTGIYCRPVCPAPTPQPKNVRFFACAAAAEAEGFRPCLRCRPESSPGTPAWVGTGTTITRALRLMEQGVLEENALDALAENLGMTPRHLRRLFQKHLGASPKAVAQTQRLHVALKLLHETALPITQVAFAAGYTSVRRFNGAIRQHFDRSPTELRKQRRKASSEVTQPLVLRLAYRPPYDAKGVLRYLQGRLLTGVERITDHTYTRVYQTPHTTGLIHITIDAQQAQLRVEVPPSLVTQIRDIVARVRHVFDVQADPATIAAHLSPDPLLAPLLARHPGVRVPGAWDRFELGVRAILGQQISVQAANTLTQRLIERWGTPVLLEEASTEPWYLFPKPEVLAEAPLATLGLPQQRAKTVQQWAAYVTQNPTWFIGLNDLASALQHLQMVPGIGPWTAHYIALRALGEPDAFPASDLGLRQALGSGTAVTAATARKRAEAWRPWRAYAAMYLWQYGSDRLRNT